MPIFQQLEQELSKQPKRWLVTGAAGFIGSSLVETLLRMNQQVTGLDNLSTGHRKNIEDVSRRVGEKFANFSFLEGDIRDTAACGEACKDIDIVLHQAALGSVPRSIVDPRLSDEVNVLGFLNIAFAAKEAGIRRFVYASSSSVYGDGEDPVKTEARIGTPLSPYAVTKRANELYASTFSSLYGMEMVGLRYFNVFGLRQDPEGVYSAVIPRWIAKFLRHEPCHIYGDGLTSRDFCFIENVVQANLLAGISPHISSDSLRIFNIAFGETTTLLQLHQILVEELSAYDPQIQAMKPVLGEFRSGDIRASLADCSRAKKILSYSPEYSVRAGLKETCRWYWEDAQGEK